MTTREKLIHTASLHIKGSFVVEGDHPSATSLGVLVDAILTTLREPDDTLAKHGAWAADDGGQYQQATAYQVRTAFIAMIDHVKGGN